MTINIPGLQRVLFSFGKTTWVCAPRSTSDFHNATWCRRLLRKKNAWESPSRKYFPYSHNPETDDVWIGEEECGSGLSTKQRQTIDRHLHTHHHSEWHISSSESKQAGKHKFTVEKNLIYEFGSVTGMIQWSWEDEEEFRSWLLFAQHPPLRAQVVVLSMVNSRRYESWRWEETDVDNRKCAYTLVQYGWGLFIKRKSRKTYSKKSSKSIHSKVDQWAR